MSTQPSNRIIREQFSEGTTIDSDRIQGALDTVEARINEIPRGDILPRYVEQTTHLGFLPSGGYSMSADIVYPWGPLYNTGWGWAIPVGSNKIRIKGCYNPSIGFGSVTSQFVWSTSVYYVRPCIITELHFNVIKDSLHQAYGLGTDGLHVLISVDNAGDPLDRHLNSFEVVKHLFSDSSWEFRRGGPIAPTDDMEPNFSENLDGLIISFRDLGVCIPAGASVRYQIVIPKGAGGSSDWGTAPYNEIIPGMTVHYLEEVVK